MKARIVRVLADYGCYPLWLPDEYDNIPPDDPRLGLSPDLVKGLNEWAAEYDSILHWDDPASSTFPSEEAENAFAETGETLARRLAQELGPGWRVRYHDGRTGTDREIACPADPIAEFQSIAQTVLGIADKSCGVEALKQDLERALAVLRRNPGLRPQFEAEILSLIDSLREGVVELVSFVMHELRWPDIERAILIRISDPGRNVSNLRLYEAMLDSFSDGWRDADLYSRFSRQPSTTCGTAEPRGR